MGKPECELEDSPTSPAWRANCQEFKACKSSRIPSCTFPEGFSPTNPCESSARVQDAAEMHSDKQCDEDDEHLFMLSSTLRMFLRGAVILGFLNYAIIKLAANYYSLFPFKCVCEAEPENRLPVAFKCRKFSSCFGCRCNNWCFSCMTCAFILKSGTFIYHNVSNVQGQRSRWWRSSV